MLKKFFSDFIGLFKICGLYISFKWVLGIFLKIKSCVKEKNLQAADRFVGSGPFKVKRDKFQIQMTGENVISGIREIWIRDVYLQNGLLKIPENGIVVDLGANIGNFTLLALASGCQKVIAVEPNKNLNDAFNKQIKINNFQSKVELQRYFIGGKTDLQKQMLLREENSGAEFISAREFVNRNNLDRIDFLKCDIEGSEYELLNNDNILFKNSKNVAIEIHGDKNKREEFIKKLKKLGFEILHSKNDFESCITLAKSINPDI